MSSGTDVSELRGYPDGHNLEPCTEGEHVLRNPEGPGQRYCQECNLSVQSLSDVCGHSPMQNSGLL